jgi:hypothetical protein
MEIAKTYRKDLEFYTTRLKEHHRLSVVVMRFKN